MELGILGTLSYLGSNYQSVNKDDDTENNYHPVNLVYHDVNYEKNINKIENKNHLIKKASDPIRSNIINNSIKPINNISLNYKDMNSNFYQENVKNLDNSLMFESFNDNLNNSNQSYADQFKPLKFDNKSKPSSINQGHKSIDRNKFNSIERNLALGNEYSLFNSKDDMTYGIVKEKEFKHNNMIPHFSKKQMINDYNEQTFAHKVDIFSGSSRNFIPKKEELLENFAPVQKNVNLVGGSQNTLEFQKGYYLPSREKRNILPFEQEQVGPGLNLDPNQSIRADGGRQEEYRPLPKSVDELRSADRPKISYKGVIKPGQKGHKGKTIGKVFKRRPEKTKEMKPEDYQRSGGEFKKPSSRDTVILKNTSRKDSKPMIGPAKSNYNRNSNKNSGKITESSKKEGSGYDPINVKNKVDKINQNQCSYNISKTQRDSTGDVKHPTHPHKFSLGIVNFNPHDLPRQTIKQTTLYNPHSGTANGPEANMTYNPIDIPKETIRQTTGFNKLSGTANGPEANMTYNPEDIMRKTTKQTTLFNKDSGYANGPETNMTYNPSDLMRKTTKQTTLYNNQSGYADGPETNMSYNPNDLMRKTTKQTTLYNDQGGYADGPNTNMSYNPDDIARKTTKQTTIFNNQGGYADGPETVISYNPDDLARITRKETLLFNEQGGYADGPNTNIAYDPSDLVRNTRREDSTFAEQGGHARGEYKNKAYDPDDLLRMTQRQGMTNTEYGGHARGDNKNKAYDPDDLLRMTQRQGMSNTEYAGHARDTNDAPLTYNPNDLLKTTLREQTGAVERNGQLRGENVKPIAFDPTDIPAKTLKELLVTQYELGVAQGIINKGAAFNPNDVPAQTLKEMVVINKHLSNANQKDSKGGYLSNKYQVPATLRQLIQILRFGTAFGDEAPRDYSAAKNMEMDDRKEIAIKNRDPTNRKHDVIPTSGTNLGNVDLKENINVLRTPVMDRSNYHSNNFNLPSVYSSNNHRQEESNRLNPEILNQLNNNPLVNNIVISQPDKSTNDC